METSTTYTKIKQAASNIGVILDDVKAEEEITNYINESLTFVSFIVELESLFGIEIPDEFLVSENLTFDELAKIIESLIL